MVNGASTLSDDMGMTHSWVDLFQSVTIWSVVKYHRFRRWVA